MRTRGKIAEDLATEKAAADAEVADIYAEDEPVVTEPVVDAIVEDRPAPAPEVPAPAEAPVVEATPEIVVDVDPDPVAANKDRGFKVLREEHAKQQAAWEAERKQLADQQAARETAWQAQMAEQARQLDILKQQQEQFGDLFKEPPSEEELEAQARQQEIQQAIAPIIAQQEAAFERRRNILERQLAEVRHTDFRDVVGYHDPNHAFQQHFARHPVLQDQIWNADDRAEAMYQAGKDFALAQPGAMQARLEEERVRIVAEAEAAAEAKYKAAAMKLGAPPAHQPGNGSIVAMGGGSGGTPRPINLDDIDPYNIKPGQRELLGAEIAQSVYMS